MSDRISLMLDNMVTAVEVGFSYDGIVSMPETGLEDAGHRPGLAGWFENGVGLLRTMIRVMRRAVGMDRGLLKPDSRMDGNLKSPIDSGIGPDEKKGEPPLTPQGSPISQRSETERQESDIEEEPRVPPDSGLPRKKSKGVPESPPPSAVNPKQPRKKNENVLDDTAHEENEEEPRSDVQEDSPKRKGEQDSPLPSDSQRLPRKKSEQVLGDIAYPNIHPTSPVPGNEEAIHPADVSTGKEEQPQRDASDQGKLPRKRKEKVDQKARQPRLKKAEDVEGFGDPSGQTIEN